KDVQILAGRCREAIGSLVRARQTRLVRLSDRIRLQSKGRLRDTRRRLNDVMTAIPPRARQALAHARTNLHHSHDWVRQARAFIQAWRSRTLVHAARIGASDPVNLLRRGFAIVRREDGTVITRAAILDQVPSAVLQLQDGTRPILVRHP
ncbi:MAG: exodeoxyribonuclease VII large subunit, partial [Opitutaceae bacterium]|nr:exodeoxyribonuclease VII large subunit [Opitutaceae bacterium]